MARPGPDPELVDKVVEIYTDTDMSVQEIATLAGVTKRTIQRWLSERKVPTRETPTTKRPAEDTTE